MLVTQFAATDLQRLAQELLGFVEFSLFLEEYAQVVDRVQGTWMLVAQRAATDLQRLAEKRFCFVTVSLGQEEHAEVVDRCQGV